MNRTLALRHSVLWGSILGSILIGGGLTLRSVAESVRPASLQPAATLWAANQPQMQNALYSLLEAQAWLKATPGTPRGYRAEALTFTDQAIQSTQAGIQYDIINNQRSVGRSSSVTIDPRESSEKGKLQRALTSLRSARNALYAAPADKGGHRLKAINQVDQAIAKTDLAIQASSEANDDPKMKEAVSQLQNALKSLQAAQANKGGHRVKAIELINQAIREAELGMKYDRQNQ